MKKGLLGSTALAGATALMAGTAGAAEAPTWKLTGNANFQLYWVDQDYSATMSTGNSPAGWGDVGGAVASNIRPGFNNFRAWDALTDDGDSHPQDHDWYFGVDEAELQLNVSGAADNGLNYGFKIEINANTTDGTMADEARLQFSGGWGTVQMGDEDGAEDIMNYGGESLMGASGGFDGDQDDYTYRNKSGNRAGELRRVYAYHHTGVGSGLTFDLDSGGGEGGTFDRMNLAAPGWATIAGDTSDQTKVSYFSPRFSGFQVGASLTPTPNNGDNFKEDGDWENHIGLGANYDNSFGDLRIRASVVYSARTNTEQTWSFFQSRNVDLNEDVSAFSIGGIVGWGPFSLGANYTDNGDSGQPKVWDEINDITITAPIETSYWNVAAGFETGPMYFSVGYFASTAEIGFPGIDDSTYDHLALTADYTVAPGLGVYAEI
ncbi:MAG: porin, partial [Proteobacteria bacterium]|nr:porin [Pseudomonadota bacterium]